MRQPGTKSKAQTLILSHMFICMFVFYLIGFVRLDLAKKAVKDDYWIREEVNRYSTNVRNMRKS